MSDVTMKYVRHGQRGEHKFESLDEALDSGIQNIEHELSVPLGIYNNAKLIYDENAINRAWRRWADDN